MPKILFIRAEWDEDADVWVATSDDVPGLATEAGAPDARFAISPLVKLECLVKPIRDGSVVLQQYYEAMLGQLVLLDLPEAVHLQAAHLRGRFSLKTPDALHLAGAQHHRCSALWTNDNRLAQAGLGLARNILTGA